MALLLPKLRPVLFDPNVNVRVRMASLMMRVSQINAMMWWTIVPVPELLYVMGNDCDAVAKIIQAMLFSQYVDCDSSESIQVRDCWSECPVTLCYLVCMFASLGCEDLSLVCSGMHKAPSAAS